jgi:hypothetical protein
MSACWSGLDDETSRTIGAWDMAAQGILQDLRTKGKPAGRRLLDFPRQEHAM